eukprot:scaffold3224_cov215-Prasinococcus_capsulatus_cf.AAC.1
MAVQRVRAGAASAAGRSRGATAHGSLSQRKRRLPLSYASGVRVQRPGAVFCKTDLQHFCAECDTKVHAPGSKKARHDRVPADD